jgi:glutamate dehydrogenase (NAD(P)+)
MIPRRMESFLRERLPEHTWRTRLIREEGNAYLEFGPQDVERLASLGITADRLGPSMVACLWVEDSPVEIGGYLVVDNLAMGLPAMGGIRMLPEVTPSAIHNLARGMTLKNAAANLPYGGGKAGIVAERSLEPEQRTEVIRGFARLIRRYQKTYLPGPDVGTNDADMRLIATENGLDCALSKPADMGGNCIDELGAAAGGVVIAVEALLEHMPRLRVLPQFARLEIPPVDQLSVLIQGFGAVGAHAARILQERLPGCRVTGVSDEAGYLYDAEGLPVEQLFRLWQEHGLVSKAFQEQGVGASGNGRKFSTDANDLLREWAFCLIPAAPVANYLDTDACTRPCMTTDRMGRWSLIVEGANTYSPDPARQQARARMEREVYRQRGTLIATDYLVNSGGVIFAAQEHLIKTPEELRIPGSMLGDRQAAERWIAGHQAGFQALAEKRCAAALAFREEVIRHNMSELVDLLVADPDLLPCEAAEQISVRRMAVREMDRCARDIMVPIQTITAEAAVGEAARKLLEVDGSLLAVVGTRGELRGVVTDWDVNRAMAQGRAPGSLLAEIMSTEVISVGPGESILQVVRALETYEISAMPVVEAGTAIGLISSDLLARRSLLRLLQSQAD